VIPFTQLDDFEDLPIIANTLRRYMQNRTNHPSGGESLSNNRKTGETGALHTPLTKPAHILCAAQWNADTQETDSNRSG